MTDHLHGAGAATNAGIDYQQRVAATLLALALLDLPVSYFFEDLPAMKISEIAFETADEVDDVKVRLDDGSAMFLQIKRSISLSTTNNSEFVKTMAQFTDGYLNNTAAPKYSVLVTSPDASSKILRELRKVLISIRLNDINFARNPLSASERGTLERFRQVVAAIYQARTGKELTEEDFIAFARSVYVVSLDVEQGRSIEKAVIISLAQQSRVSPDLLWAILIKNSLTYAAGRFSLNKQGIESTFGRFMERSDKRDKRDVDEEFAAFSFEELGSISSGKEILLIDSFLDSSDADLPDLFIFENFRFGDDCSVRFQFYDRNKCRLIGTDYVWTVWHRSATFAGLYRSLEENADRFIGKRIMLMNANDIDEIETTPCAKAHSGLCQQLLRENQHRLHCLHCGKAISEDASPLVEIDDIESPHAVGYVHKECLRPIDRVIGRLIGPFFEKHGFLKNFDVQKWVRNSVGGQGIFHDLKATGYEGIVQITWKSDYEHDAEYGYCIVIHLADGTFQYVADRGKVHRFPEAKAREAVERFHEQFARGREVGDPICYTSKRFTYGPYSLLITRKADDETCLECKSAEIVPYNSLIGKSYDAIRNYYAPLCLLILTADEAAFMINSHLILLSDPLSLPGFMDNWQRGGHSLGAYEIKIIESDKDFDDRVRRAYRAGHGVIVDPLINTAGQFVKGILIEDLYSIVECT